MTSRAARTAVDEAVQICGPGVDEARVPSAVHHLVIRRGTQRRFSSTGRRYVSASNGGQERRLSPVSTVAKTMDENLNSLMVNDQSNSTVDNVDISPEKIHSFPGIDGGRR